MLGGRALVEWIAGGVVAGELLAATDRLDVAAAAALAAIALGAA